MRIETRLLRSVISSNLKWHKNTEQLTKKGFQRMIILRNLVEFDVPQEDLVLIYCQYIRSVMEFNSSVWFSTITQEEKDDLEKVQRCAIKLIMKEEYQTYEDALERLKLQNLSDRREMLALRFAKKCTKHEKSKDWFPLNESSIKIRNGDKYKVNFASTGRLQYSAIPAMRELLNAEQLKLNLA